MVWYKKLIIILDFTFQWKDLPKDSGGKSVYRKISSKARPTPTNLETLLANFSNSLSNPNAPILMKSHKMKFLLSKLTKQKMKENM